MEVATRKHIARVALPGKDRARLMVSSPDDHWLFVCSADDTVTAIDGESWRARPAITLTSRLASLAFDANGARFATNTEGRVDRPSRSVAAQTQVWSLAGDGAPRAIAWRTRARPKGQALSDPSPDAPPPSSAGWDGLGEVASWPSWVVDEETLTSADGQWKVRTSTDERGRMPSVINGPTKQALPLEIDLSDPNDLPGPSTITAAFSSDARWLAAARSDRGGPLRVWPLRADDLANEACARVARNLKLSEWEDYPERPFHATCSNLPLGTD
jgi:hypothetical protein